MNDSKRLLKALRQVNATPIQARMAAILLAVNGLENALEFVRGQDPQLAFDFRLDDEDDARKDDARTRLFPCEEEVVRAHPAYQK